MRSASGLINFAPIALLLLLHSSPLSVADAGPIPSPDRSTPNAGYQTFLDAVKRRDITAVMDSYLTKLKLSNTDRMVDAERLILDCQLYWAIQSRFSLETARDARIYAALLIVPQADAVQLKFKPRDSFVPGGGITAVSDAQFANESNLAMARTNDGWRVDLRVFEPEPAKSGLLEASWRNAMLQDALQKMNDGKISDVNALHAALVPVALDSMPTTRPLDRTSPADVPWAIRIAADAGDVDAVNDCYTGGIDFTDNRNHAQLLVLDHKLDVALHKKFGRAQGDRLVKQCNLAIDGITEMYSNIKWSIDGDVARGLWYGERYDPAIQMLCHGGKWRIVQPSGLYMTAAEKQQQQVTEAEARDELRDKANMLAHLENYPDPGSVLDVLDMVVKPPDPKIVQAEQEARRREIVQGIIEMKRGAATRQAALTGQERDQDEIITSFMTQLFSDPKAHVQAQDIYVVDNDPNQSYVHARNHRIDAANALLHAAEREVDSSAYDLQREFTLTDAADDWEAICQIVWSVQGDSARGNPPEGVGTEPFWTPRMRKVNGEWKVDLTDEIDGDVIGATARAEREAKALEQLAVDVNSLKYQTLNELRTAMKAANIQGTRKPT